MFYRFNSIAGRVVASTQMKAYMPQGLSGITSNEVPQFQFDTAKTEPIIISESNVTKHGQPGTESLGFYPTSKGYQKTLEMQKKMNVQDGLLVWQKLGGRDNLPYGLTVIFGIVGTVMCLQMFWQLMWPKSSQS